ncbi:MAG: TIGR03545 family protein [Thiohalorhabdus sp.]
MARIVRWWGLGAFLGLVVLAAGVWWLFADYWLERAVESAGSRAVGARVELREAKLDLFPARVRLHGLQVTNPRDPMRNAFQAERVAFDMDLFSLVLGRTRIDEVAVEGAAAQTPRARSGALEDVRPPEPAQEFGEAGEPGGLGELRLPDAEEVLAEADLRTVEGAEGLERDIRRVREDFEARVRDLPDREAIEVYEKRVDDLKEADGGLAGLVKGGQEAARLREDIRADLKRVEKVQADLKDQVGGFRERLARLKEAPGRDARRLVERYGATPEGLGNVAPLLFGERVGQWVRSGWYWYGALRPYLEPLRERIDGEGQVTASKPLRAPGLNIRFPEEPAEPDTVVRTIRLSTPEEPMEGGVGLEGRVADLSFQPSLWPEPLTADVRGRRAGQGSRVRLEAVLDHRQPGSPEDRLDLRVTGADAAGWRFGGGPLEVVLEEGRADLDGKAVFRGEEMDVRLQGDFADARMAATGEGELAGALAEALTGVSAFTLSGRITGTPRSPRVALDSSLQEVIGQTVERMVEERLAGLKEEVQNRLEERARPSLREAEEALSGLRGLEERVSQRIQSLEDLPDLGG